MMTRRDVPPSILGPLYRGAILLAAALLLCSCLGRHTVTIRSDPSGAVVRELSRGDIGNTDLRLRVKDGDTLNLSFTKNGFEEEKVMVSDVQHDQTVMVTLHEIHSTSLHVLTLPAGARIELYRGDETRVELENPSKIPGEPCYANRSYAIPDDLALARIVLSMEGYKTKTVEVRLEPYKENRFTFTLERVAPTLRIESPPVEGADVFETRLGYLGRTPFETTLNWQQIMRITQVQDRESVSEVTLYLRARKAGYGTAEKVEVVPIRRDGSMHRIEIPMAPAGGESR